MDENRKELEIVKGDGSNLDISPVYEHITTSRPKSNEKKPTNIIVPTSIKSDINNDTETSSSNETIDDINFETTDNNENDSNDSENDANGSSVEDSFFYEESDDESEDK